LKVIRHALVADSKGPDDAIERLLREATLASALNHPNIVTIHETGTVDNDRYIAMELVEGRTLRDLATEGLPLERTVAIARQIAEALAVAHTAQIVHRDIKPDNVMVRPDGYIKLLDFGLARVHHAAISAGPTGIVTEPVSSSEPLATCLRNRHVERVCHRRPTSSRLARCCMSWLRDAIRSWRRLISALCTH
jgi:serine/threonine-protein kinase